MKIEDEPFNYLPNKIEFQSDFDIAKKRIEEARGLFDE